MVADTAELERALEYPWERWTVFLHPTRGQFVERDYSGPARISGFAGTGKTIAALHRAVFLARHDKAAQVLLTTFSSTLANALKVRLERLAGNEPDITNRIRLGPMTGVSYDLYAARYGKPNIVSDELLRSLLRDAGGGARPAIGSSRSS